MRRRLPDMRREVARKSDAAIELETALKWAGRAVACRERYARTGRAAWLLRARDYAHEALEHAALVGDYGRTAAEVQRKINEAGAGLVRRSLARRKRRRR